MGLCRLSMGAVIVFLWLGAGIPVTALAAPGDVRLTLSNPEKLDLRAWPVTIGIPFAAGELPSPTAQVLDSEGVPVPAQVRALARWWGRDGSVSVLLVTFLADTAQPSYTLRTRDPGANPRPQRPVTVQEAGGAITVSTGPLEVRLRASRFNLLDRVTLDTDGDGAFSDDEVAAGGDGGGLFAGEYASNFSDAELTVEESGPLRAVVRAAGACRDAEGKHLLSYVMRFTLHAGSALVQLDCTVVQDSDECFVPISQLGLTLPLRLDGARSCLFVDDAGAPVPCPLGPTEGVSLCQTGPEPKEVIANADKPGMGMFLDKMKPFWTEKEKALWERDDRIKEYGWTLTKGAEKRATGERNSGQVQISAEDSPLGVSCRLRWFRQLHPKGIGVDDDGLNVWFWPKDAGMGPFDMHRGLAKTHSVCFVFHRKSEAESAAAQCRAFERPPIYFPSPERFRQSRLWGDVFPRTRDTFRHYETMASRLNLGQKNATDSIGGMLNFGDKTQGAGWWNNMETALDHGMFVQFFRTGDRGMFDTFEEAANHFRDIDVYHVDGNDRDTFIYMMPGYLPANYLKTIVGDPQKRRSVFWHDCQPQKGGVYRHSYRHRGNGATCPYGLDSSRVPARGMCYSGSCGVGGHGWMVGLVDHYMLTGDRRSLEVAEEVGEYMLKHHNPGIGRDNWININLVALYKATGNPAYRELVEKSVEFIYGQRHEIANGSLKAGVMSPFYTILVYFRHLHALTGDKEIARKFRECVDLMLQYEPTVTCGRGKVWKRVQEYRDSRYHGDFADLAYAYALTGDRRYVDAGLSTFALYLQHSYHSTFAYEVPVYLSALHKLGISILDQPGEAISGRKIFWRDDSDTATVIHAFQNHTYRAPVQRSPNGKITVTAPSGREAATTPCTLGGLNYYRLEIPRDGETGAYKIAVTDPPGMTYVSFLTDVGELTSRAGASRVEGRHGPGMHLTDLAVLRLPVPGNLNASQGTVEIWFKPDWTSPEPREADVPYSYTVLFDSRNQRYTDGFYLATWDSGKKGTAKSLYGAWSRDRKATNLGYIPLDWPEPDWHHAGFTWETTDTEARGFLFLDGRKHEMTTSDLEVFPTELHPEIIIGANTTFSTNTPVRAVVDAVRISSRMKAEFAADPEPVFEQDTLYLSDMSLCLWLAMDRVEDGRITDRNSARVHARIAGAEPAPGVRGAGMRFNGDGGHVAIPVSELNIPETPTWSAWVRPERTVGSQVVVTSGSYGHFELRIDDGRPSITAFARWDGGKGFLTATAADPIPTERWSHIAGTFDGHKATVYVDGEPAGENKLEQGVTGVVRPPPQSGPDARVGTGYVGYADPTPARSLHGTVDEVRLYCRPLTPADFRRLEPWPGAAERNGP